MINRLKISLALIALALICLTGCHGSKGLEAFEMPDEPDTTRDIEITFWNKNDSNKIQVAAYKKAISDFEKLYPNIHVKMKAYTDYSRIYNDVITNIATGTTPNVCITYPDHIATYRTGINIVVPLNTLMNDPEYGLGGSKLLFDSPTVSEITTEFLNECAFDENYYALPFMRSTEACYINKTMVEALGYEVPDVLTWDYIWEVSEKATEKNPDGTYKINGQNVCIPFIYKSTDNMLITQLKQKDAGYSTPDGDINIFNDTTSQLLTEIASHAESGAFSTFKISSYPANFLNAGQCIFAIDSTAGSTWMGCNCPNLDIAEEAITEFEMVVRPIPQFDVEHPKMISQGPSLCIFNKEDPQEVLASWLFATYLLSDEVQIAYAQSEGYIPVTSRARNSEVYQEYLDLAGTDNAMHYQVKMDATKLLMDNTSNVFVTPVFNGSASLRTAAGTMVEDVCKAVRRKNTVNEAFIEEEYRNVTGLYRLDQMSAAAMEKQELGDLPSTAVLLLSILGFTWLLIAIRLFRTRSKKLSATSETEKT